MWFFMILSYVMMALSGIGLLMVGINHYFDFWAQNHITLDLLVSIVFIAGQTLVMFFFVGTGVNIREYLEANPSLGKDLYSLDDNNVIFGQVSNGHDVIEKMVKT